VNADDLRNSEGQRPGLVQDDGVHVAERFEVDASLDDCALSGGATDGPEDGEGGPRRDAACASYDDDGDGRPRVVGDEERQAAAPSAK
jgi:hypothetical protein